MFDALLERNPNTKHQKRLSGSSFHLQASTVRPKSPSPLLKQCLVTNTIAATAASQDRHQSLHQQQQHSRGVAGKSSAPGAQSNKSLSSLSLNVNCDTVSSTPPTKKPFTRTQSGSTFISLSPNVKRILSNLDDRASPSCDDSVEKNVIIDQCDRDNVNRTQEVLVNRNVESIKSPFVRSKSVCNPNSVYSQKLVGVVRPQQQINNDENGSAGRLSQVSIKYETKTSVRKSDTDIHLKETSSAPSSAKSSPFWTKIGQKQFTTSSPIKNSRNSLFEFRSKAGSQDMLSFDKPEQRRSSSFIKMEYSSPVDETSLDDTSRIPKIEIIDRNSDDNSPNNSFDVSQADICQNKSNDLLQVPRPLSMTSITSSTSTSSASSGVPNKNNGNAYLASIESLDDDSDCDNNLSRHGSTRSSGERRDGEPEVGSQGSGDSGILANGGVVANAPGTAPRPRYCDPDLSPEERVLIEIYDTEAVYVSALREVIQGYLTLWEEDNNCILSNYIPDLFSNLKEIYEFNSVFLYQLQEVGPNAVNISKVFINNHDGFKIYTDYCTNYPKTMSVLTELMSNDITAKVFRDQQARLGHSLPLGSYLLKPVQRILKYHLLLQNLVKECSIEDVSDVKLALSTMTGIAHHINDMKRKHEHAVRVQEIQSLLYGWDGEDLTTFGELCVEGSFRMHGAKAQRHAFLFDKMLLLTKNREDGILSYKLHIMCSNLMLIESVQGEPLSFHVIPFDNPKMQCTLQARNLEQKREWTLQLKRVILENYNAVIPSHARQLVMELGQNKTDDDVPLEKSNSSKKPHSAPEYLQRRRIDRERRKSETGLRSRLRKSRKSEPSLESEQEITPFESGSILSGENSSPNMQIRNGHRDSSQSRDRSKSREPFMKFGSWRRKSEPGIEVDISNLSRSNEQEKAATLDRLSSNDYSTEFQIPHYNSKTLPKKIYKMKKAKNKNRSAKFYTDLSDAINNDEVLHISESNDDIHLEVDLTASNSQLDETPFENNLSGAEMEAQATLNMSSNQNEIPETIEDIVSQLLMQNREFQKIFKKQKKQIGLRNRINKTSALNSKPKVDKENGSSDSEIDTSLESYENLLNNSECQKNNLDKESTLMTKSNNIYSNEDYNIEEKNSQNKQRFSVESKCLTEENKQIYQNGGHLNNYRHKIFNSGSNSDAIKFDSCQKNECIDKNLVKHDKDIYVNLKDDPFVATDSKINLQDKTCSDSLNNVESGCKIAYESINHIWQAINSPHTKHPLLLNTDEQSSPNTPEVWLKCQNEHMTVPKTRKSGSLPRSFELINEKLNSEFKYLSRDGKLLYNDRPLTIASESTTEIDFEDLITKKNFSEIQTVLTHSEAETKKQGTPGNAIVDTSLERNCKKGITDYEPIYDVPNADQDVKNDSKMINLNFNIHPEYKIYRPCVNLTSFKNVFVKTSYRRTKSNDDEIICDLNDKEKKQTTVMKNYSRSLLQRFKSIVTEDGLFENSSDKQRNKETIDFNNFNMQTSGECTIGTNSKNSDELQTHFPLNVTWKFPNKNSQLPIYKQGSKSLGARIAQSDYANPHDLFQETGKENVLINKYSVRPDSLLSNSSHFTSSSDSCTGDDHDKSEKSNCSNDQIRQRFCSATGSDSFYEKTFEAIETIKDDVFRDSAVYSDHDDLKINSEVCNKNLDNSKSQEIKPSISKVKCKYPQEIRFEKIQGRITKNHQIINRNIKGIEFTNEVSKMKNNLNSKKQMKKPNKLPPPVPLKPEFSTIALKSAKEMTTLKSQIKDENTEIIKQITEICDTRPTSIVEKLQSLKVNSCLNDCDNGKFEIDKAIVQRRKDLQAMSTNSNTSKCNFNHKTNKHNFSNTSSNLNEDRSQLNVSKSNDLNDQYANIATTNKNSKCNEHSREKNEAEIHRKLNKSADNLLLDKEQVNNDNFPVLCNNPSSSGWVKHVVGKFQ